MALRPRISFSPRPEASFYDVVFTTPMMNPRSSWSVTLGTGWTGGRDVAYTLPSFLGLAGYQNFWTLAADTRTNVEVSDSVGQTLAEGLRERVTPNRNGPFELRTSHANHRLGP